MKRFITILAAVVSASGCIPPDKPARSANRTQVLAGSDDAVALEVNGEELSVNQIRARQDALQTALPANTRERQFAVIADFEILADAAEKRGYGNDPRVVNAVKDALANEARRLKLETEEPEVERNDEALARAFEAGRKQK